MNTTQVAVDLADRFLAEVETTAHVMRMEEASILYALRGYGCPEN